ncbi:MAG: 1-deoxy-D-xylulose-5-phosphate synthase, partial [Clostridium sp.]|nr:1-deoxy-D-xylulose-5-phosphate synthase [Clostridium sp.]
RELSKEGYHIVTVEDNMKNGGLGTLVLKELTNCGHKGKFVNLGYDDKFINQGNVDLLYEDNGLDGKGIADTVLKLI